MENKVYKEQKEKTIDFLIGFFGIPLGLGLITRLIAVLVEFLFPHGPRRSAVEFIPQNMLFIFWLVWIITPILLIIYFWRRRKFIASGLLYAVVIVPLVLLGTCFAIFLGGSMLSGMHH